jgi:hypothetical protein
MSGDLTITKAVPSVAVNHTAAGVGGGLFQFWRSGVSRWALQNYGAESSSNIGSDFYITRYSDAGAQIDSPLAISRATGVTTLSGNLTISRAIPQLFLQDTAGSPNIGGVYWQRSALNRWQMYSYGPESGSNVGSDFYVARYNDAGTAIDNPLRIDRATGIVTAFGLPPRPTLGAGALGEWRSLTGTLSAALALPGGGTWAWIGWVCNTTSGITNGAI